MIDTRQGSLAMDWLARREQFDVVGSTNDVVTGWLRDGTPEVCLAVAGEQTAGRGRNGRTWTAPAGAALLASLGFRPTYLEPGAQWRLGAIVSLAMADAIEAVAGTAAGTVRLKWPNDLVVATSDGVRKLAGVLGETVGAGTDDPQAVIGIGVNVAWPRTDFPPELAASMTSVSELAPGAGVRVDDLIEACLGRLRSLVDDLRTGTFPAQAWRERQLTSGSIVRLERPDGSAETVRALDVDPATGALVIESLLGERPPRAISVGEIRHLRVGEV